MLFIRKEKRHLPGERISAAQQAYKKHPCFRIIKKCEEVMKTFIPAPKQIL